MVDKKVSTTTLGGVYLQGVQKMAVDVVDVLKKNSVNILFIYQWARMSLTSFFNTKLCIQYKYDSLPYFTKDSLSQNKAATTKPHSLPPSLPSFRKATP